MTTRIELDDDGGEWMEINKRAEDEVKTLAMSDNLRYGDALAQYLNDRLTDESDE